MATVNAYYGLDFLSFDLNWYVRNFLDSEFYDNSYFEVNGSFYEDSLFVNGYDAFYSADYGLFLFGSGISFDSSGRIVSGQVSVLGEFFWAGDDTWLAEGVNLSAVDLYQAALTPSTSDDLGLVASALSGSDFIDLSDDWDRVSGFDGNDEIYGRWGNDYLYGGFGDDQIYGEGDSDFIFGQDGNDVLDGGAGNDTLNGDTGNDWLRGGTGTDEATGGSGADDFVFFVGDDKLTITDFEPGVDDLVLGGVGAGFKVQDLIPFVSQVGDDVVIAAGAQEIRFEATQLSELSAGDVVFV